MIVSIPLLLAFLLGFATQETAKNLAFNNEMKSIQINLNQSGSKATNTSANPSHSSGLSFTFNLTFDKDQRRCLTRAQQSKLELIKELMILYRQIPRTVTEGNFVWVEFNDL